MRARYEPDTPRFQDLDMDGAHGDVDCDDKDPQRYPGAADIEGDGIDTNCDGVDGWRDPNTKIATPPDPNTKIATPPGSP